MGLRDLKRDGHYLGPQSLPQGEWVFYEAGDLVRCPAPRCNRGFMQPGVESRVAVRVAVEGIGEAGTPCAFLICQDGRCKSRLEVRITLAPAEISPIARY